jgi:hypothetical protein
VPRALAEHASTEYANTFQRAFDTYQQRYGAFSDSENRNLGAFSANETGTEDDGVITVNIVADRVGAVDLAGATITELTAAPV